MIKLPHGTRSILENLLPKKHPKFEKFIFSTFYIHGAFTEEGDFSSTTIKPRFIVCYSNSEESLNKCNRRINHFLGDAFKYESKEDGVLPEEYSDMTNFLMYRRSRAINADEFNLIYESLSDEAFIKTVMDLLFKSTMFVEVEEQSINGTFFYVTKTYFVPSIGTVVVDSGDIALRSMPESIERVLSDTNAGTYEQLIDYNFDTCYIKTNRFHGEVSPPTSTKEFVSLIRKNLLISQESVKLT
jgi:hypothetical protein